MESDPKAGVLPTTKVLVVDDRPENLFAMKKSLAPLGTEVLTAQSGNEALALTLHHDFAVVLLDVQMPEMDGFEVAFLMRDNKKTTHVPIIFLTAISKEDRHIFKGYESGAVDYLFKPIEPEILQSKVRVFCDLHRQRQMLDHANRTIQKQQDHIVEEERLKVLLQMAGATAHDLNQPLIVLLNHIERMMMDKDNPEELNRHMTVIEESGQRIADMVKRIQFIQHGQVKPGTDQSPATTTRARGRVRLLCVEDSNIDFRRLETVLKTLDDIEWSRARSIAEAMSMVKHDKFDLVFLDYVLPDGYGLEFLEKVAADGIEVPVVVISGQDSTMVAAQLMRAGAYDYLTKGNLGAGAIQRIIEKTLELADLRRESIEAQKMIAEMSTKDGLTGLHNRRFFTEALEREVSRAIRYKTDLVLCMIDLDHFKQVNDTRGHVVGDAVLSEMGQLLHACFRETDVVCRYGGEEFAVILPCTQPADANLVCERFRSKAAAHRVQYDSASCCVTVSVGLASLQRLDPQSPQSLLQTADEALYRAKETGRNRVVEFEGVV